jgi:MFS family permease
MPPTASDASPPATIPRPVKGLAAVSLLNDFASEMVYPLLPAFVVGTLGGNPTMLGALDGAADFTAALTKWFGGRLADRPRRRRALIVLGYLSASLVRPLMSAASAAWQVVGLRVIDRVGKGLRTPARDALIADVTPAEIRGRAFGFHRAADHFGSIPGSLLAWWLLGHAVDVRQVLAWSAAPGLLAGLVLLFVLRTIPAAPAASLAARAQARADATGRTFWAPVLALAALALLRLPETLLLLRLQDLGVPAASIPLVWAALHVVRSAASYPGGWVADRVGSRAAVATGAILFAAGAALLGFPVGAVGAATVFVAMGLVAGLTESAERSLVARLAPRRTGRGFGAYHAVTGLAALPAATAFGLVYQRGGGSAALWASAAGTLLGALAWLALARPSWGANTAPR